MWVRRADYISLVASVAELTATKTAQVEMVERLNSSLTKAYAARDAERKRSDNAIDRMLNVRHLPAVTPPDKITLDEISGLFEESPDEVAALQKTIEERGIEEVLLDEVP